MSHSSVANPVARRTAQNLNLNINPRRRKLSDLGSDHSEMALASDSLFDKFGLFAEQVQTCHHSGVQDEAVGAIADTGLADFENLDFADLLEIKDDPIDDQIQLDNDNDNLIHDPAMSAMFNMDNMESLMDDASLDSIKSDCMWSSVNLFPTLLEQGMNINSSSMPSRKRRHRDVSLTLSECAEGLLSINQLDVVNMLDQISGDDTSPLGASPTFLSSSFGASMMTSKMMASDEQNSEGNDSLAEETETDEDDEIDVVGDLGGSSARTRHCNLAINRSNNKKHHLKQQQNNEQSRSLLKKQQKPPTTIKTSILDDHCYFLARPQKDIKPLKGMLTPNESSEDDEDLFESQTSNNFNTATTTTSNVNLVDKRKIAEAVQSLINNKPHGQTLGLTGQNAGASANPTNNNIKFKFRMKFKSTQAASNMKKAVNKALTEVNSNASDDLELLESASSDLLGLHHHRVSSSTSSRPDSASVLSRQRRKSASKNSYCPTPGNSRSNGSSPTKLQKKSSTSHSSSRTPPTSASRSNSNSPNLDSPDSEKCREIRDLHNSMERQRRVEQRNHLAYLKKQVPEVSDMEKASKLTILRKAMDYCHLLSNMDSRIRKDRDKEQARNQMLKKKLLDLTQKHDARRVTTSGRLTGWTSSQRW